MKDSLSQFMTMGSPQTQGIYFRQQQENNRTRKQNKRTHIHALFSNCTQYSIQILTRSTNRSKRHPERPFRSNTSAQTNSRIYKLFPITEFAH